MPSKVDSNKKQAKSSIGWVEEETLWMDRMGTTVSGLSQATVHLADKTPWDLYYECLDEGEAQQFPTPKLLYKIDMQARYDAARATVLEYTLPVPISKKTSSQYSNSDEDSDGSPSSPKRIDATEMKIDEFASLYWGIASSWTSSLWIQASSIKSKRILFCPLIKCLTPWRKYHHVDNDYSVCGARHFQGPGLLQHWRSMGDEYHTAIAFYFTTLFDNCTGLAQAAVHHGENDQRKNLLVQTNGFFIAVINLLTVKNQTILTKWMKV